MSEQQPRKRGRPKGSKDKSPRPKDPPIVVEGGLPGQLVPTEEKPLATRRGNAPASRAGLIQGGEDRAFVAQLLNEVLMEYKQPKVRNDEELSARLDDYFARCAVNGQVPTVEEAFLSVGYDVDWEHRVENGMNPGFSDRTKQILRKAKQFLKTFDAKLVISGKMNFLAYCFRAKNYYGMSDKTELTVSPGVMDDQLSVDDIAKRYELPDPDGPDYDG